MKSAADNNIAVIGLGKLGSPIAAALASRGFTVVGVDVDRDKVNALQARRAPVREPGLDELLVRPDLQIEATTDIDEAARSADVVFIIVPTPSRKDGEFSIDFVLDACKAIGRAIRDRDSYVLVSVTSTVMPGDTGGAIVETLESNSGKAVGPDFGVCYSPEFVALGSVIRDFLSPDFLLIGQSDERAGRLLEEIYRRACGETIPVARMDLWNAELAKLAVNTFITAKISFSNMLARICDETPEGDVDAITAALGLDTRIGPRYLKGSVSYGGPCFPRDNIAITSFARRLGTDPVLPQAIDTFNRHQIIWLADKVEAKTPENAAVGIVGLSYKPETDVTDESTGWLLAQELDRRGLKVVVFDDRVATDTLSGHITSVPTLQDLVESSATVVLTLPLDENHLSDISWSRSEGDTTVIDCWGTASHLAASDVDYFAVGRSGDASLEVSHR